MALWRSRKGPPPSSRPGGRNRNVPEATKRHQTFSYYTSGPSRPAPERLERRKDPAPAGRSKSKKSIAAQWPFWLLIVVVVVCVFKFAYLGTAPRIIVVDQTSTSRRFMRPEHVYAAAAAKLFSSSFTNRFKLTADSSGIASGMIQEFPELQAVSVALPFMGNRPIVYLVPASPSVFIQSTGGSIYAVNSSGIALAKVSKSLSGPLVADESGEPIEVGRQVLPGSTVSFIHTVLYQLGHAKQPVQVASLTLPAGSPYELDLKLKGKSYISRFNLQEDAKEQAGTLLATLHKLSGSQPGSYIDLRVPGRVYYK